MGIIETPTKIPTYYKSMQIAFERKLEKVNVDCEMFTEAVNNYYKYCYDRLDWYKEHCNVDLTNYDDFNNNCYSDDTFFKVTRRCYKNRVDNYKLVEELFNLHMLAIKQRQLDKALKEQAVCIKALNLNIKEYREILKVFYTQVQRVLIVDGNGYKFDAKLGWTCIARYLKTRGYKKKLVCDYKASKANKEKLIKEGKRPYDKATAEWCKERDIPYDGVEYRVYRDDEAMYILPLINYGVIPYRGLELRTSDFRGASVRGKSNEDLIEECNSDIDKIMNLDVDLRVKLNLCNKIDETYYLKFVRNENQKPIAYNQTYRKDR